MIFYYDNGPHPLLRSYFTESGVSCSTIYTDLTMQRIDKWTHHYFRPRSFLYNHPVCPENDDKIIIFDTYTTPEYLTWLCRRYSGKRIILWYWNPLTDPRALDMLPRRIEIWSYSEKDCEKYGFRHNTAFYFDCFAKEAAEAAPANNRVPVVLFVGRDKGRRAAINRIGAELENAGMRTEFHIVPSPDRPGKREDLFSYREVTEMIRRSDMILDYTNDPEAGLSLRAAESLFWGKKLITNNRSILQSRMYRKNNIYLLGEEDRSFSEFLASPYEPADESLKTYYLLSSWLKRFDAE